MNHRAHLWVLLCALVLGLLGMHHLSADGHGEHEAAHSVSAGIATSPHGASHEELTGPIAESEHDASSHNLMHLCLAVLCAAGAAFGALLVLGRLRGPLSPAAERVPPAPWRHAPIRSRSGPGLLATLCVLRL